MKKYTAPELEIMEFELEDVLTASNPNGASAGDEFRPGNNNWY